MKPWQAAAVAAVGWIVLMIVVGIIHTEVLIQDITPRQDEALSYLYGQSAGLGAILLGIGAYLLQKRRQSQ